MAPLRRATNCKLLAIQCRYATYKIAEKREKRRKKERERRANRGAKKKKNCSETFDVVTREKGEKDHLELYESYSVSYFRLYRQGKRKVILKGETLLDGGKKKNKT